MGEILPDGSIGGWGTMCSVCGQEISVNMQGDEIGKHHCQKPLLDTELRIGNLIFNGEKNWTVDANLLYDISHMGVKVFGIPITTEILEKIGFYIPNGIVFIDFKIRLSDKPGAFIKIDYLHQFQNVLFALTGKELEVTLL